MPDLTFLAASFNFGATSFWRILIYLDSACSGLPVERPAKAPRAAHIARYAATPIISAAASVAISTDDSSVVTLLSIVVADSLTSSSSTSVTSSAFVFSFTACG